MNSVVLFNPKINAYYLNLVAVAKFGPLANIFINYTHHMQPIKEVLNHNLGLLNKLIPLDIKPIISCYHPTTLVHLDVFKQQIKNLSGIYLLEYKHAPNIYYIGRSIDLTSRLSKHFKESYYTSQRTKLHTLMKSIGPEHLNIHILQTTVSSISLQIGIENQLLIKFDPILNKVGISKASAPYVRNFRGFLKNRQRPITNRTNKGEYITFLYFLTFNATTDKGHISFIGSYSSLTQVKNITGAPKNTITDYINTDYPKNGYLYYSPAILDLSQSFELTKKLIREMPYKYNKFIPVWAYKFNSEGKLELMNNKPFPSKQNFANFLNLNWHTVDENLNSLKPDSRQGVYSFDSPISKDQLKNINMKPSFLTPRYKMIYLYSSPNLELVNGKPFKLTQENSTILGINRSFFFDKLDTNKCFLFKGKSYLAYTDKLTKK